MDSQIASKVNSLTRGNIDFSLYIAVTTISRGGGTKIFSFLNDSHRFRHTMPSGNNVYFFENISDI